MNIDLKKAILDSQQRIVHLTEIEAQLNDLPEHLRALLPHLDAIEKVGDEIHALGNATRQYIPDGIGSNLAYIYRDVKSLHASLIRNGNPLIATIEPTND